MDTPSYEEIARCLFEESNDGFLIFHPQTRRVEDANPAIQRMTGWRRKELLAMKLTHLLEAEDPEAIEKLIRAFNSTGFFYQREDFRLLCREGGPLIVNVSGSRIHTKPEPLGLVVVRDVTDRKRAEADRKRLEAVLQQAQKLESLGLLAGGIAHDFNNLLVGILGNAGLGLMDLPHDAPLRSRLQDIETAAQRAADLCRQLLAYAGKSSFIVKAIDLSDLVREMSRLLEVSISKRISIEYRLASHLPAVQADPTQLRQVVMNLITNASDAIGDAEGRIILSTGAGHCDRACLGQTFLDDRLPVGTYVHVEVSDTGRGMDEETKKKIFDPFFTTKLSGRGLGLAAVLGIVRAHRGALRVESQVGQGTTFRVLLPASQRPVEVEPHRADEEKPWMRTGHVLVVDDEDTVRVVARMTLEPAGFSVTTVSDGLEAIQLFREQGEEFDVVLLDLTMPHMSGEETFQELRRIRPGAKIILSSGYNEKPAIAGESVEFLPKPWVPQSLLAKIGTVLASGG